MRPCEISWCLRCCERSCSARSSPKSIDSGGCQSPSLQLPVSAITVSCAFFAAEPVGAQFERVRGNPIPSLNFLNEVRRIVQRSRKRHEPGQVWLDAGGDSPAVPHGTTSLLVGRVEVDAGVRPQAIATKPPACVEDRGLFAQAMERRADRIH